ncbi:Uncharacterised protein [Klebsiella pneumoniae]|nr:Uncharacterised protein [Klebsiella pneumoniae]SAW99917.1 Uncharacterised protein [Klebsiella pneumoniae]
MKKRVYLQILLPVLMTLIVLSVTNYFIVLSQKDYQSRVAERLLQYSERVAGQGNDSNLLIVFYVQIMPDDFVMQLHRF